MKNQPAQDEFGAATGAIDDDCESHHYPRHGSVITDLPIESGDVQ